MKAQKTPLSEFINKPSVQRIGSAFLALLVISSVAYFGSLLNEDSEAAVPGTMYVSPVGGNFNPGSNVTVDIREDSGAVAVSTVQSALVYNKAQLQFVSVSDGAVFPGVLKTDPTVVPGQVRIARAVEAGANGVTGDQLIARVTFKVLSTSGNTSFSFANAFSAIVRSGDSSNIMRASKGAVFSVAFPAPTLTASAPASGLTAGDTALTLSGTNFRAGATVKVGDILATNVVVVSPTLIKAMAPAHASGPVAIVVSNPDGKSAVRPDAFTYKLPAPAVASVTVLQSMETGAKTVSIAGSDFINGATVRFGTVAASHVAYVSSSELTATVPAQSVAGAVNVIVSNPDGQSATKAAAYSYQLTGPVISSLSQDSGFTAGGLALTITGRNFAPGSKVFFGEAAAKATVLNPTTIQVVTPFYAVGIAAVTVTRPDGQSASLLGAFTYRRTGDSNGDVLINALDYSAVVSHEGQHYPPADYDGDGTVGAGDLAVLLANWTW
jgi:hypothetical protein